MDKGSPNEENADTLNKAAPEILSDQLETATGPGPSNLYYKPAFLNLNDPAALQCKTVQILFFSLLLTASAFALIAFILLICFFDEENNVGTFKEEWAWAATPTTHEAIMILFGVIFQGFAILVYRIIPCCSINVLKYIHFGLHTLVGFFMLCGLIYVYLTSFGNRFLHFATQHSWAGIVALSCFMLQLTAGTFTFIPPMIPVEIRTIFLPIHKAIGWVIYLATCTTALLGITNVERKHKHIRDLQDSEKRPYSWSQQVGLAEAGLLVRFAFLFLLFHVLIMLYLWHCATVSASTAASLI